MLIVSSLLILFFLLSLSVGSFSNVIIFRTPPNKRSRLKYLKGRSHCPHCKKTITWKDNIPVLSFLLLKGRCRYCKKPISWQYPLVESATALLAILLILKLGLAHNFYFNLSDLFESFLLIWIIGVLVAIFVYDLRYFIIPNEFVAAGALLALGYNLALDYQAGIFSAWGSWLTGHLASGIFAALIAGGFFLLLVYISKEKWMGWGDVKFAFFMGFLLGYPLILVGLFLSFFLGAAIGVFLIIKKKKSLQSEIPFGPFLCLATFISLLFQEQLANLFYQIFGW